MNCAQGGVLGYFALLEGPHSPWPGGCSWPMGQAGIVWRSNKCVWQLLLLKGCFVVGAPFNKVFWGVFGFCAVRTLFFWLAVRLLLGGSLLSSPVLYLCCTVLMHWGVACIFFYRFYFGMCILVGNLCLWMCSGL